MFSHFSGLALRLPSTSAPSDLPPTDRFREDRSHVAETKAPLGRCGSAGQLRINFRAEISVCVCVWGGITHEAV